jgi:rare lipoprotein A (peptidoglycan hydrolase)
MLCFGVLVLPLLLLATPGRAVSRPNGAEHRPDGRPVATGASLRLQLVSRIVQLQRGASYHRAPPSPAPITAGPVASSISTATTAPTTTTTMAPPALAVAAPTTTNATPRAANQMSGQVSWYGTAAGTCASPFLSFGTEVTVTDDVTGASVSCMVDDREAENVGRVLDLSEATFSELADPSTGIIEATISW